MPAFANPFQANVERTMTLQELLEAIRLDIASELEAIYVYDAHVQATDNEAAKKVLSDIRDEEKAHVGELETLLGVLDPSEISFHASGEAEVHEMLADLGHEQAASSPSGATVGSLLGT